MMIFLINCDLIIFNIKKIKIGLCCLAKQENKYIKEYVDYYLKLGFHKIIWFDNNNIDREIFKKIHCLKEEGFRKKYSIIKILLN